MAAFGGHMLEQRGIKFDGGRGTRLSAVLPPEGDRGGDQVFQSARRPSG